MTHPLTVEIHGTGTQNRGAELMAIAIADRMRSRFPGCRIVVPPEFGSLQAIHAHGFCMSNQFTQPVSRLYAKVMPPNLRRKFGLIGPESIDVVLDASGFSYSDQWGESGISSARSLLVKMQQANRKRQPLVLLPQAFGPFRSEPMAAATRNLLQRAALVYARDQASLKYVQDLRSATNTRLCPDFTLPVAPRDAEIELPPGRLAAIVPNSRMLDKSDSGTDYLAVLERLVGLLPEHGFRPFFLLHDAHEDRRILEELGPAAQSTPCLSHPDPRVLKWILSQAGVVIGSRFHALASALSQGTPCIAIGWSHKYRALFQDFGCGHLLLESMQNQSHLNTLLSLLAGNEERERLRKTITQRNLELLKAIEGMWLQVEELISTLRVKRGPSTTDHARPS